MESIVSNRDQIQTAADNAYIGTNAAVMTSGVITALTASGVGIPVATLLAGALLISDKMFKLIRGNLMLRLLIQDAIFIIMDCYLLFNLIKTSYFCIGKREVPTIECVNNVTEDHGYQINHIMEAQLHHQITRLINVLIHLIDTNNLNILKEDATFGEAFKNLLGEEYNKRQKEAGVRGYFSMSKMTRNFDRKFGGSYYTTELNNILNITNSYIGLLKSQLDTVLKKFEILDPEAYKTIWREILCSIEYNSYIKPVPGVIIKRAETDAGTADPGLVIAGNDKLEAENTVIQKQAMVEPLPPVQ